MDVSCIAADFNAALIVHPRRLLQSPSLAALPQDELGAAVVRKWGVDPRSIDRAVVLMDPLPGGKTLFFGGAILRFAEAVDGKKQLARSMQGVEEVNFNGKKYYKSKGKEAVIAGIRMCGYVADERTIVIAPEPMLRKMIVADDTRSPLIDRLRSADLDQDVVAVFLLEPFRALARERVKSLKSNLPAELAALTTLPDRLQSMTVSLNLTGATFLKVDLEANSEESGRVVLDLAHAGQGMARSVYPNVRQALKAQVPNDLATSIFAVADGALDGIRVQQDGSHVLISLKAPPGLAELPGKIAPLLRQAVAARPSRPAPNSKDVRHRAVAWVRANSRFGPEHKIVTDTQLHFESPTGPGHGFLVKLGGGLVKSKRPTLLVGWADALFVFELTAEQARLTDLPESRPVIVPIPSADDQPRGPPQAVFASLKIEQADHIDSYQNLKGSIPFKRVGKGSGPFALRLTYLVAKNRFRATFPLGNALAGDRKVLEFALPSMNASGIRETGPMIVILELVGLDGVNGPGKLAVLSNPVATLVEITGGVPAPPGTMEMVNLRVKLPPGWQANFNKSLREWKLEKHTRTADGIDQPNTLRLSELRGDTPETLDAYAARLKEKNWHDFGFFWPQITEQSTLPDGFVIKGLVQDHTDPSAPPRFGLVMVREICALKVRCKGTNLRSEAIRQEAMELFKTAAFGTPR